VSDLISEYFAERPQVFQGSDAGAEQFEAAVAERQAATLARLVTRAAFSRMREARRLNAAVEARSRENRAADNWCGLAGRMLIDAEALALRAILARDPAFADFDADDAEAKAWAPRGLIDGGTLYLAIQSPDRDPIRVGEPSPHGVNVMYLAEVPLANIHDNGGANR
jgi:hypothetical protein